MRRIVTHYINIFVPIAMLLLLLAPVTVSAAPQYLSATGTQQACTALGDIDPDNDSRSCDPKSDNVVQRLVRLAVQLLSIVAGIIAVIMIIVAGLRYITSQGEAAQTASAKNALIYALVGIVVVAFAQVIVRFVLSSSTS